ncbi:MAG: hypothetical protein GY924_13055, partial [Planctomycetaceae bacterium]|nr:hypothetical protein [Planctomycetaceae bacterium]
TQGIFDFGLESGFHPSSVVMFSGGLDSYAGALEELIRRGEHVVLVSHGSSTKLAHVQRALIADMRKRLSKGKLQHIGLTSQLSGNRPKERTQRSRSFLFASLGIAVAEMFGLHRISFFENGVVSLNLPLSAQVVGARATRTTHPKVINDLGELFSQLLGGKREVLNPFLYHTKGEVVETIRRLGFQDQIRYTHSCADVHNRSRMHTHCGRCSQCIDRRFAILAQGLADSDPAEAYAVDLMNGSRTSVMDREMVLSFVRNARLFSIADQRTFLKRFPEIARAVAETGKPAAQACVRLHDLFRRHGQSVTGVMQEALERRSTDQPASDSLLAMYAEEQIANLEAAAAPEFASVASQSMELVLNRRKRHATLVGLGLIERTNYRVLDRLAEV